MREVPDWWYMLLHPRPAYLIVSGLGEDVGVMTASWVMPVAEEPPRLAVAMDKEGRTYSLLRQAGEFTVNVIFDDHLEALWLAGTLSGWRVKDKLRRAGIKVAPSKKVSVPRVADAAAVIECRLWQALDVGETALVIGDVLDAYVLATEAFNEAYGWVLGKARIPLHLSGRAFTLPGKLLLAGKRREQ